MHEHIVLNQLSVKDIWLRSLCNAVCSCICQTRSTAQVLLIVIPCGNTWSQSLCNYCVWHPHCVGPVFEREVFERLCWAGVGYETQCGSGSQRNDFQRRVTRLKSWMWSLPYVRGTRAFKGNCIPPLLFLLWHFPPSHRVYIWFRPEIPPVQRTQREHFSS